MECELQDREFQDRRSPRPAPGALGRALWLASLLPLVVALAATVTMEVTGAELDWCRQFFGGSYLSWPLLNGAHAYWVDRLTVLPGYALGISGLAMILGSLVFRPWRTWRNAGLFLVLVLALGPGLAVNGILKPNWGRPRPEETQVFGGPEAYYPPWDVHWGGHGKSFPSGHASMAFYVGAPAFLCLTRRRWAWTWGVLGVGYGVAVGLTRIVQGQHFPTDVLWSGIVVYFTALGLYLLIRPGQQPPARSIDTARDTSHANRRLAFALEVHPVGRS